MIYGFTKGSIFFDRNHRLQYNFSILFENNSYQHLEKLKTFSSIVFEILKKYYKVRRKFGKVYIDLKIFVQLTCYAYGLNHFD